MGSIGLKKIVVIFLFFILIAGGCAALKESRPILPMKEYERMLAGRLDADYVGNDRCLESCHVHDKVAKDFAASTMGVFVKPGTGMSMVDCESCHGPGSLAIKDLTRAKVRAEEKMGKKVACDFKTLIDWRTLPPQAQSLICLKCHTANATFNLHDWNASTHATNDVSCLDCHKVHQGPDLTLAKKKIFELCIECHQDVRAELSLPSRHPILEGKISCVDCHEPHGTITEKGLKGDTVKIACTRCHAEKEGPFVFEHADLSEDCRNCHKSHGSVNNDLLTAAEPFLCLQCHNSHQNYRRPSLKDEPWKEAFYNRCTDCHPSIHGTDKPSGSGQGTFLE
jgi:DmsE family decaheme c-type cytochrome